MVRNIFAVIAGYIVWTVVFLGGASIVRLVRPGVYDAAGFTSDTIALVLFLLLSVMASGLAGALTARLCLRVPALWAVILAGCLLATGIPVQLSAWDKLPVWYNAAFLVLLLPATWGGALTVRRTGSAQVGLD